jgi:hypothetical protein
MNPQVIRLMLDRSKFSAFVVPSAVQSSKASIDFYKNLLKEKHKQALVLIFPDFNTCTTILRCGAFEPSYKYILCAPLSKLEEQGLEPVDATFRGAVWQAKQMMSATVNSALMKAVIDDELIKKLSKKIERIEHQFSNPKNVEAKCTTTVRQAIDMLGEKKTPASEKALLKFLVFGFVAKEASKGGDTVDEIITYARKRLRVKNKAAFTAFVKAKKIPMTAAAAKAIYEIQQLTSFPKSSLKYLWLTVSGNRPDSLASCETGCDGSLGVMLKQHLSESDFPISGMERKHPTPAPAHNACTVILIKIGWHTTTTLLNAAGFFAKDDASLLAKSDHPVKLNKHPLWRDNKAWWAVTAEKKDSKPLMMLFAGRKFRFEGKP